MDCPSEGLSYTGRPDEAQDRRLPVRGELEHRKVFHDALLDLREPEMLGIQNLSRGNDGRDRRLRLWQAPGKVDQPVEMVAQHAGLRRRLGAALS